MTRKDLYMLAEAYRKVIDEKSTNWLDTYDWTEELSSYYDITTQPNALTLEDHLTIDEIKGQKYINAFKAVYDPHFKWFKSKDRQMKPYESHFGSFIASAMRFEIMEQDGWRIYKLTLDISSLADDLAIDPDRLDDGDWASSEVIEQARLQGDQAVAYANFTEGSVEYSEDLTRNISIIALSPNIVLTSSTVNKKVKLSD